VLAQDESADASLAIPEKTTKTTLPNLYAFYKYFEEHLRARSGFKKYLSDQPFYSVYNCGKHVFSPWKVVWREQANPFIGAVVSSVDGKVTVPDHKLMIVPLSTADEAFYVCGCLTNSVAKYIVASYAVSTAITTHVLNYVSVPKYNPRSETHRSIRKACAEAHRAAAAEDREHLESCQELLDGFAGELWGLSAAELVDVQKSLKDLQS
jgi:hypothetical protein